jgi:hypothetical protein
MNDRLSRWTWWLILRASRRSFAKNFNYKVARYLRPDHARHFIERGKVQNTFARKHGLALTKFAIGVLEFALLCTIFFFAAHWLFDHGYFTAPGSPDRQI